MKPLLATSGLIVMHLFAADLTPTSVTVASSANPSMFGQSVVLSATVSPAAATGRVTFYDGAAMLGVSPLANGSATFSTALLASGTRSIHAYYAGDATHASSISAVLGQKVNTVPADSFAPGPFYHGFSQATSVAVGDFNGDGIADLAIVEFNPGSVSIRLGNGDGTFQSPVDNLIGRTSGIQSIAIGDFNGDGKSDLAVADIAPLGSLFLTGAIEVFLGNGDGTFQGGLEYATGMYTESVVVADFNGDGIADLAAANRDDDSVSILLGNGDGTFQQSVTYPAGVTPYAIATGDFNGDGTTDLAVANWDGTLNLLLGNGDGSFQPRIGYPIDGELFSVVAADFNGDGHTDLAFAAYRGGISVFLGDGNGGFQYASSYNSGAAGAVLSLATCDCNGDGKPDLAFATSSGGAVLLAGNGDGTFQFPANVTTGADIDNSVAVGDFNGDGKEDLVLASQSGVSIFFGRVSLASSTTLTSSNNPSVYSQGVVLIAAVSPSMATGTVSFWDGQTWLANNPLSQGRAELSINQLAPGPHSLTAIYSGDAVYLSSSSPVLVQTVNQSPSSVALSSPANPSYSGQSVTLTASIFAPVATPTGTVEFHDGPLSLGTRALNGGTAYLITSSLAVGYHLLTANYSGDANFLPSTSQVLTQSVMQGTATTITLSSPAARLTFGQNATFTAKVSPAVPGSVTFYDGVTMLGTIHLAGGQASLTTNLLPAGVRSIRAYYRGSTALYMPSTSSVVPIAVATQPVNQFQAPVTIPSGPGIGINSSIAMADFNGDGKFDLASVAQSGVAVALGNGDGTFQTAVIYSTDAKPGYVATGDFNGDGKADLAVMTSSGTVSVLLGNGDGTFQQFVNYGSGPSPGVVTVADVNGDGYADLALSTGYVLLGNGDGTFQNAMPWLNRGYLAVGDFNGDGKIDFIDARGVVELGHDDGTFDAGAGLNVVPSQHVQVFIAIGDFNGDGNQDVAAIIHANNPGGNGVLPYMRDTLTVYLGQGDGTFRSPVTVADGAVGQFPGAIAAGDFNGDGRLDIALVYEGTVKVFPGNGDGSFVAAVPFSANAAQNSSNTTNVLLGDFNGDGRTDIAFAGSGIEIQLGQLLPATTTHLDSSPNPSMYGQDVTLTATVQPSTATGTITFYDAGLSTPLGTKTLMNGQASIIPPLLKLGTHTFSVLYSGDANFPAGFATVIQNVVAASPTVTLTSSANPAAVGQTVFLVATVSNAAATGTVTFQDGGVTLGIRTLSGGTALLATSALAAGSHSLTAQYAGDANDLAGASAALMQTIAGANPSTVGLTSSVNPVIYGQSVTLMATVSPPDATGMVTFYDGVTVLGSMRLSGGQAGFTTNLLDSGTRQIRAFYSGDTAHVPAATTLAQVVRAQPANGFNEISQAVTSGYGSILTGDFNGDGKPDVIVTGARLNLLLGNGDGTFQPPMNIGAGRSVTKIPIATADFNGDGKADLVYSTGSGVTVLLGNGDGTFQPPISYKSNDPVFIVTGDFNGDGIPDIAVLDYNLLPYSLEVLLGKGDGTFEPIITSSLGFNPNAVVVGDFNGDGKADLAIPVFNTNTVAIMLGNGDGTFQNPVTYDTGGIVIGMALGDFNGDGRTDLAAATTTISGDGSVNVLLGNGDGTFGQPISFHSAGAPPWGGIVAGDFNGDGHADIAVSNYLGINVLSGNGDGTFKGPTYTGYSSSYMAVADFNGDGKTDIAIGSLSVFLGAVTSVPSIVQVGPLNAAAGAGPTGGFAGLNYTVGSQISPGGLATVFGNFPLASADAGKAISVQVGGVAVPALAASTGQITFQVPWELQALLGLAGPSQSTLAVTVNGQTSAVQPIKLQAFVPGIFTVNGQGSGQGAIFDLSNRLVDSSNPATAGSTVQIYCTGLGKVSNQPATGATAPGSPLSLTSSVPKVSIGYVNAPVLFSGLVPGLIGVYQVNATVPEIPAASRGPATMVGIYFGNTGSNVVTMAVQ